MIASHLHLPLDSSKMNIRAEAPTASPCSARVLPSWPSFGPDEIEAVRAVLDSGRVNYWTGEEGRRFEEEYASSLGVAHAIGLANGTVALELPPRMWGDRNSTRLNSSHITISYAVFCL